jgi:hypothetical protein
MEATQQDHFVLSIDLSKYRMTSCQELAAALSYSTHSVCRLGICTLSTSCGNSSDMNCKWRSLIVETVTHKDLGGNQQVFLPKHVLQTAVGIMFVENNVDLRQLVC